MVMAIHTEGRDRAVNTTHVHGAGSRHCTASYRILSCDARPTDGGVTSHHITAVLAVVDMDGPIRVCVVCRCCRKPGRVMAGPLLSSPGFTPAALLYPSLPAATLLHVSYHIILRIISARVHQIATQLSPKPIRTGSPPAQCVCQISIYCSQKSSGVVSAVSSFIFFFSSFLQPHSAFFSSLFACLKKVTHSVPHHVPPLSDGHEGAERGRQPEELVVGRALAADEGVVVQRREDRHEPKGKYLKIRKKEKKKDTRYPSITLTIYRVGTCRTNHRKATL